MNQYKFPVNGFPSKDEQIVMRAIERSINEKCTAKISVENKEKANEIRRIAVAMDELNLPYISNQSSSIVVTGIRNDKPYNRNWIIEIVWLNNK